MPVVYSGRFVSYEAPEVCLIELHYDGLVKHGPKRKEKNVFALQYLDLNHHKDELFR